MKIAFFEVEDWEIKQIKDRNADKELKKLEAEMQELRKKK